MMTLHGLSVRGLPVAFLAVTVLTGCPRVLYLDYQPSASIKGNGPVRINAFSYAGHSTGLIQQKEVESGKKDPEVLYLSQDIGEFFAAALTKELTRAGYEPRADAPRAVSGTIEQFSLDYVGPTDQLFKIETTFHVVREQAPAFTTSCRSKQQQAKDWMKSGSLIERGIRDCIEAFVKEAQTVGAL
ncbi:MAG TPA: hypothetical protein VHQ67_00810 [Nitrospiraceae bacterium]|jgi:hypothetical protein|nr:hypothetical protein [Nitrospiraceae bacterium]